MYLKSMLARMNDFDVKENWEKMQSRGKLQISP